MPETEQQQAAAPAANDTSTSWNFGDFAKGLGSPLTKNENGTYNIAGALLTGAGTGLATWFLSRILGIKSGPSLGISILAGLAGAHGAFTKQGGLDFFSNPKGYLKDFMDQKRVDNGSDVNPDDEDAAIRRQLEEEERQVQADRNARLANTKFNFALQSADEEGLRAMSERGQFFDRATNSFIPMTGEQKNMLDARLDELREIRVFGKPLKDMTAEEINRASVWHKLVTREYQIDRSIGDAPTDAPGDLSATEQPTSAWNIFSPRWWSNGGYGQPSTYKETEGANWDRNILRDMQHPEFLKAMNRAEALYRQQDTPNVVTRPPSAFADQLTAPSGIGQLKSAPVVLPSVPAPASPNWGAPTDKEYMGPQVKSLPAQPAIIKKSPTPPAPPIAYPSWALPAIPAVNKVLGGEA